MKDLPLEEKRKLKQQEKEVLKVKKIFLRPQNFYFCGRFYLGGIVEGNKSLKQYAKEAKKRMKSSFWQDYKARVEIGLEKADNEGTQKSKVVEYYQSKVAVSIRGVKSEDEEFYNKVKDLLIKYGDVSDAIGRLTDKEYFSSLSYDARQRYLLELSNKYIKAKERYYKEMKFENFV